MVCSSNEVSQVYAQLWQMTRQDEHMFKKIPRELLQNKHTFRSTNTRTGRRRIVKQVINLKRRRAFAIEETNLPSLRIPRLCQF